MLSSTYLSLFLLLVVAPATVSGRPNIVLILTDDQDVTLGGLTPLRQVERLLGNVGGRFVNAFATTPLCCPSRSSILTGLYAHVHGTLNNSLSGGCCDRVWRTTRESGTFAALLSQSGYRTFYAGKYLNKYGHGSAGGVGHVPKGWDWWIGLVGNSVYYNYTLSVNGSAVSRGDGESDYLTDVLRDYALDFLRGVRSSEPFLMVVSPPAPHEPFTPARRHAGSFANLSAPRTPNFNYPTQESKHWLLRLPPNVLPPDTVARVDKVFRDRWETLLAVDELVAAVVERLNSLAVLDNTFVMFTSDHGFHLGQFGQPWDKRQPYETDIRIPLVVRGPGVRPGSVDDVVLNIDLAPTILDMANVTTRSDLNGKSFLPSLRRSTRLSSRTFLVEHWGERGGSGSCYPDDPDVKLCSPETSCKCFDSVNNTFVCLRHISSDADDVLCLFDQGVEEEFAEHYDLRTDPYQLVNLAGVGDGRHHNADIRRSVLECCRRRRRDGQPAEDCFDDRGRLVVPEII